MRMKDQVVVVTGGGTGIGRATSLAFAREGANVVVNYARSKDEAGATVAAIEAEGGTAVAARADVTVDAEAVRLVADAVKRWGRLDVLVNNAGWSKRTPHHQLADLTDEVWNRTMDTNLRAAFYVMRAAAPVLKNNPGSSIVNIASAAAHTGSGSSIVYAASKAGLLSMTKSFARILAPEVRVNAIAPGLVRTRFAGWPREKFDEAETISLLKRIASPEDVAKAAVFLVVDAPAITGETINIDAGYTAVGRGI